MVWELNKKKLGKLIPIIVLIMLVISSILVASRMNTRPSTDDAFLQADVANIAPEVSGRIISLNVTNNQSVHAGDILFIIARVAQLIVYAAEWTKLIVSNPSLIVAAKDYGSSLLSFARSLKGKEFQSLSQQRIIPLINENDSVSDTKAFLLLKKINELIEGLPCLKSPENRKEKSEHPKQQLFVTDAFNNPVYVHYALKSTLAIFIAYITYNMLNWPEIRTCMITCFFVALGSTGETFHKMTLRITGAIIGGALGFATIIFIMPYLTTIMGLCLVIAVVSFFAAWVATSSELLSYAGFQIALAFFISILDGYGPSIDLTLARDRIIGILLGNLIVFVVFSLLWPVSSLTQARSSLSAALKKLSQTFFVDSTNIEQQEKRNALFFALGNDLSQVRRLVALNRFEPLKPNQIIMDEKLIDAVQALIAPALLLDEQIYASTTTYAEMSVYKKSLSELLSLLAEHISNEKPSAPATANNVPFLYSLEYELMESSLPIGYVDWMHTLDWRLHELIRLIRREIIQPEIEFKQSGREML